MVVGSAMYEHGRKCWFCCSYGLSRLRDKRVWCSACRSKYSLRKLKRDLKVLYYFYLEVSARKCARELGLNYKTIAKRYMQYREAILRYSENDFKKLHGKIEADESYFGGKRKGNRGRGAFNKQAVFGILERNGRVYTAVVENVSAKTLFNHIKKKTRKGSVFYTDCFKSYKDLKQYGKHNRVKHSKTFGKGHNHINGIEGFWSFAKERFHKYHGINKQNYPLYIKEMEFRFNNRKENLYARLIGVIRQFAPKNT
ncbi:MAG: IS1595 family transposase [Candidatus Diapherotrites archaeon]|nr:IS1595 family transposase [Candidatus Diapherotrites archaeon]